MKINERLKELRVANGLSQEDVAKFLNISKQGYGYYENNKRNISSEAIVKLAEFYQVSADYLLGLSEDPTPPKMEKRIH